MDQREGHKQSFRTRASTLSATERFISNTVNATAKVNTDAIQKVSTSPGRRRLLLTQSFELLHSQLLGGDRVSVLLNEERLGSREKAAGGRIERIKILPKPQHVKLIAALLEGLRQRHTDAAPFIA